jgi:ABC-type methionine transport system ATPase subunit
MTGQDSLAPNKFIIQQLSLKRPNGITILHDISLEIPAGSITAVIGPSGSGKSSLLRCLNRLWEPPPGSIFIDGRDITAMDVLLLRRRVGMLFQTPALFEGTVADNIAYGPGLQGRRLASQEVAELLQMASLDAGLAEKPVDQLSGGQAQRVSLARTLANQPDVLLLDEPTSALDPAATRKIESTIRNLRDTLNLTVLWVSHAFEQVERTADRIVLLVDGRVAETGDAGHLLSGVHHHLIDDFAAGKL